MIICCFDRKVDEFETLHIFTVTIGCWLCGVSSLIFVDGGARMIIKLSGKKRSIQYDLWKVIFECGIQSHDAYF